MRGELAVVDLRLQLQALYALPFDLGHELLLLLIQLLDHGCESPELLIEVALRLGLLGCLAHVRGSELHHGLRLLFLEPLFDEGFLLGFEIELLTQEAILVLGDAQLVLKGGHFGSKSPCYFFSLEQLIGDLFMIGPGFLLLLVG